MHRPVRLIAPLAVAALLTLAGPAAAQTKPFKIVGGGVATTGLPLPGQPPRTHWSVGTATHLGLYYGEGMIRTDFAVPDFANGVITGEFGSGSPYVFTAANGDKLVTYYGRTDFGAEEPGNFTLTILGILDDGSLVVSGEFVAEFVAQPDLSTGRFAGVTGSWIMLARTGPFVLGSSNPDPYYWQGEGQLTFPKGE